MHVQPNYGKLSMYIQTRSLFILARAHYIPNLQAPHESISHQHGTSSNEEKEYKIYQTRNSRATSRIHRLHPLIETNQPLHQHHVC